MVQKAVWFPEETMMQQTRLFKWMNRLGYTEYDDFYKKSIENVGWFWHEAARELDLKWYRPYDEVLQTGSDWKYPRWFVNGQINVFENAVGKWARNPETSGNKALIWEGDSGETKIYTFAQLNDEVHACAAGFLKLGVSKGDVVTIYMPMIPETVISMLALAKIGAITSPVFSGYGAEAIATRVQAAGSKYMVTADGFSRRGKKVNMKQQADLAMESCPTILHSIVVSHISESIPRRTHRDIHWETLIANNNKVETLHTAVNDPLMLIYTSGTTGKPKGAVHTHGGFPVKAAFDAGIGMDVRPNDTFFWYSDMGWMMGPFLLYGGLVNGAAIMLFEGVPDFPDTSRIWQLCHKHHVTHLGISPTFIRSIMNEQTDGIKQQDLSSLRVIGSTGEPWNPDPWNWLFREICQEKIPIVNYSGGTEISGGILGNTLLKPISPITFNTPLPGMHADVYDGEGNSVTNKVGELVIKKPWVGMTNGFWKENHRYESAYWHQYENTWVHGDWVIRDSEGFWTITGRSDDILNIAGKRIGPAEVESVLVSHPSILESATIGVPHPIKGECAVCFTVTKENVTTDDALKQELLDMVALHLGKALRPQEIHFVGSLPKTRNGKIMRRVIKSAYLGQQAGDLSSLENPDAVEAIQSIAVADTP
ncbi:MAG: AMP-binding protein [Bacillus sp. (in: firmicutes)]